MARFKKDEVVVLLGAGASVDAKIPHTQAMVKEIANLVEVKDATNPWRPYRDLFNYLRSACHYSHGLRGLVGDKVPFNIETLVNTLDELDKNETHPLYPFVGAWNPKLLDVAGPGFGRVRAFRDALVAHLRTRWIPIENYERDAGYFRGLSRFACELEYPLRVFTLNYDLCVEKVCGFDKIQRGFDSDQKWDWRLFDETEADEGRELRLYKLHGSTDWQRLDEGGPVTYVDDPERIPNENVAIIFGTTYKFQYVDPFLFLAYEFRRWTLAPEVKLIVCIGYGFADEHINGILRQALKAESSPKVLSVSPYDRERPAEHENKIALAIGAAAGQAAFENMTARDFLSTRFTVESLSSLFPEEPDPIKEIP